MLGFNQECSLLCVKPELRVIYGNLIIVNKTIETSGYSVINPRRACAARVTVVGLCVRPSVRPSVNQ